jgi:hypothetical protein
MTTKLGEHIVTLSSDTLQRIDAIALYRQEQKRGRGQTNQKISKEGALQIEISGLKGEFAVAQYYDIEPNLGIEADEGWDLIVNGTKIDVKYTKYERGDLFFTTTNHFKADIAILAVEAGPSEVELKGWMDRKRFLAEALHHAPHKMGQKITTWMGVGMTQPDAALRECEKCSYHYAPINRMKTRV